MVRRLRVCNMPWQLRKRLRRRMAAIRVRCTRRPRYTTNWWHRDRCRGQCRALSRWRPPPKCWIFHRSGCALKGVAIAILNDKRPTCQPGDRIDNHWPNFLRKLAVHVDLWFDIDVESGQVQHRHLGARFEPLDEALLTPIMSQIRTWKIKKKPRSCRRGRRREGLCVTLCSRRWDRCPFSSFQSLCYLSQLRYQRPVPL